MRDSKTIYDDIEEHREALINLLERPHALLFIDLQYIAGEVEDLKQELRMAKARESVQ